jgi:GT2 family glycosyltransferase
MLLQALESILEKPYKGSAYDVIVVSNGAGALELGSDGRVRVALSDSNLGVPAGRDFGLRSTDAALVGFLDDDAEFRGDTERILEAFESDPRLGVISMRLVDEYDETARRHVPRTGGKGPDVSSEVAYFLGGACAIRRSAYEEVGGYFTELFYGHEEIELSWRLIDAGWSIRYLADVEVFHPRTEISRHAEGWFMTGRNRVWIARRTLPWPIALLHVTFWLVVGAARAPKGDCRAGYLRGWRSGWRDRIEHRPIRWSTVWKLTRLGRPPVI